MAQMVFVPLSRAEATSLRDSGDSATTRVGYAATHALLLAHGYDEATLEDAEYAALGYAGAHAAIDPDATEPLRLVLAVDASASRVPVSESADSPYGQLLLRELRWADVRALFSDEQAAAAAVAAARQAAGGRDLADALLLPEVEAAVDEADLLWFAPEELDRLP